MFQSTSSVDENDWLLDSSSRRRKRNWTVTFCSFFFCLLYAVALATILGSIGYFGIVQHSVSNWDGLGSAKRPCILHSEYEDNHFVIGDNNYCVLTFGGESVLALACLVLLSISLFQVLCGRWNWCTAIITMLLLILALCLGLALGINFVVGYTKTCRSYKDFVSSDSSDKCSEYLLPGKKNTKDGHNLVMAQAALLVCYTCLCVSLVLEILMLCCCMRKRPETIEWRNRGNDWIDNDVIMKRKKPDIF